MAQPSSSGAQELSGQDLVYGYLSEHLDGDLSPAMATKYEELLKAQGSSLPERFQALRGKLQLALQSYYLKESELQELRALVQDPSVTATIENVQIEKLGRGEVVSTLLRRAALVAVAAAVIAGLVWKFGKGQEQTFKPLEYLGYEALAMEEEPTGRLNLPTQDGKEINRYLTTYPGLEFKPMVLKPLTGWQPDGATVIDYEIAKVAVVQYGNTTSKEKLFHFSYAGELADLPKAEPGNMRGLIFQTYASDELNLIAWQSSPGVVSLLVGRRSAPELAELAVAGSK
jgi:hypothetical protein